MLWIVTLNGVARFDGRKLVEYQSSDRRERYIESSNVIDILEGKKGKIFAATRDSGLLYYEIASNSFSSFTHHGGETSPSISISAGIHDAVGNIWLGYSNGELAFFDSETSNLTYYPRITEFKIADFSAGDVDYIYAVDVKGSIFRLSKKDNQIVELPLSKVCQDSIHDVTELSSDRFGSLWIGTKGNGLFYLELDTLAYECRRISLPSMRGDDSSRAIIHRIKHQAKTGLTWIATDQGLYVSNNIDDIMHYDFNNSELNDSEVTSITWGIDDTL